MGTPRMSPVQIGSATQTWVGKGVAPTAGGWDVKTQSPGGLGGVGGGGDVGVLGFGAPRGGLGVPGR